MSFIPAVDDLNTYHGTALILIERTITNLEVDWHVTTLFGDEDKPFTFQVKDKLESVTFPPNSELNLIESYAFNNCSKLTKIDLSPCSKLATIDSRAFHNCYNLGSVIFPNQALKTINENAFEKCGITEVFIPKCVESLGIGVFCNCTKLTSCVIESDSSLTLIPRWIFCHSLVTSFCITKNVISLGDGVFEYASKITEITIEEGNTNFDIVSYSLTDIKHENLLYFPIGREGAYDVPNGIKCICFTAFSKSILTNITFPETLLTIGNWAFAYSKFLTSIVLPNSLERINNSAFIECTSLSSVTISNKCTTISEHSFNNCDIKTIVIPEGVEIIKSEAFVNNDNMIRIELPSTLTTIEGSPFPQNRDLEIVFSANSHFKKTADMIIMNNDETIIVQYVGFKENDELTISNKVQVIKLGAFQDKPNIASVTFPADSVLRELESNAFRGCANIKSFDLPESVERINYGSFAGCKNLVGITLKSKCNFISSCVFEGCEKLETIDLSTTQVVSIAEKLFYNCYSLHTVHFNNNVLEFYNYCFGNCYKLVSITPQSLNAKYIGDYAFLNTALTSVSFSETSTVADLRRHSFEGCQQLNSVQFCSSIKKISPYAFHLTGLTAINLTPNIEELGSNCFSSCGSLVSFHIPEGTQLTEEKIGIGLFSNSTLFSKITCASNKFEVSSEALFSQGKKHLLIFPPNAGIFCFPIPNSVNTIGNGAFYNCKKLNSIIIPQNSVKKIGNSAFEGCSSLHYINIPIGVQTIGESAFRGCVSLKCGVDIEITDKKLLKSFFEKGELPLNCDKKCDRLTCKIICRGNLSIKLFNLFIPILLSL